MRKECGSRVKIAVKIARILTHHASMLNFEIEYLGVHRYICLLVCSNLIRTLLLAPVLC
jgi:hypothetical protein